MARPGLQDRVTASPTPAAAPIVGRVVTALRTGATLSKHDIDAVESIIAYTAFGGRHDPTRSTPTERSALRSAALALLRDAPDLDTSLGS